MGDYQINNYEVDIYKRFTIPSVTVTLRIDDGIMLVDVTPQTRGSVDYPSTRGIQVDVGLPDATFRKSGRVSFVRGALPKYKTCINLHLPVPNSPIITI